MYRFAAYDIVVAFIIANELLTTEDESSRWLVLTYTPVAIGCSAVYDHPGTCVGRTPGARQVCK